MPSAMTRSPCLARSVLEDGVARVQSAALQEHAAQRGARTLGGYRMMSAKDDARALAGDAEPVQSRAPCRGEVLLDLGPYGDLTGIREQVLDDGARSRSLTSMSKRVCPVPSRRQTARSQLRVPSRWPTMTLKPLSRRLSDWPGPVLP